MPSPPPPSYNGLILDGIEGSVYPFFRPWKGKRPFPRPSFKGTVRVTKFGYKRGLSCDGFIYGNLVNPWGKPFQPIYPQPFYYVPADLTCDDDKGHGGGGYPGGGGGGPGGGGGGYPGGGGGWR